MTKENILTGEIPQSEAAQKSKKRANRRKYVYLTVKYAVAAILIVFFMFPYLFMINKSLMSAQELQAGNTHFFPQHFTVSNYTIVKDFWHNILNTLQVVLINGFFAPFTACFCAFPFARHNFKGKKFMFAFVMSTVLLPTAVLMIPQYFLYSQM